MWKRLPTVYSGKFGWVLNLEWWWMARMEILSGKWSIMRMELLKWSKTWFQSYDDTFWNAQLVTFDVEQVSGGDEDEEQLLYRDDLYRGEVVQMWLCVDTWPVCWLGGLPNQQSPTVTAGWAVHLVNRLTNDNPWELETFLQLKVVSSHILMRTWSLTTHWVITECRECCEQLVSTLIHNVTVAL